jgi:hypothetical protein
VNPSFGLLCSGVLSTDHVKFDISQKLLRGAGIAYSFSVYVDTGRGHIIFGISKVSVSISDEERFRSFVLNRHISYADCDNYR